MTGGNGFEIVCDVIGHSHELFRAIHLLDEDQTAVLMAITEVAQARDITCQRCSKVLVVRLFHHEKEGLILILKEKS